MIESSAPPTVPPTAPPAPSPETMLALAYDDLEAGDPAGAERRFREVLAAFPACAEAHGALAALLAETGRPHQAVAALRQAAALEPDQPRRLAALADGLAATGDRAAAADVCRRWLSLCPGSVPALLCLADQLLAQGCGAAAAGALREAVLLDPGQAGAAATLAGLLLEAGDPLAALELVQPTLRRIPDHPALHHQLGRAWRRLGESARAEAAWRRCLALEPGDPFGAGAALAALSHDPAHPPSDLTPDPVYVRALFDRYAERFDADLVDRLGYRAPELLLEAIRALPDRGALDILDLGCGTGLAGAAFAPLARCLAGVDLAPRMIEQARRRGLYAQLEAGDLMVVLEREPARWDLIVASDVFTYLGDLGAVLKAVAAALRPGGRVAATVELAEETDAVTLSPSRRFRHGAGHIEHAASAAGLSTLSLSQAVLRQEARTPVIGLVWVAERRL